MTLILWDESYTVHVPHLDAQHQKLFDTINKLHTAVTEGAAGSQLRPILRAFVKYSDQHFADEEKLFSESGYPDVDSHRKLHADFRAVVIESYDARTYSSAA